MKTIFFVFFIVIHSGRAILPDVAGINEGASTSTSQTQVTQCENCEIMSYAERVVRLLIAEDNVEENLAGIINNRFDELEAYHNEVLSYFLLAEVGNTDLRDTTLENRNERLRRFRLAVRLITLQMVQNTCTNHFRQRLWYEYNREHGTISLRESMAFLTDDCLCRNSRGRSSSRVFISMPSKKRSQKLYKIMGDDLVVEISTHYIIPIALLSRFSEVWLSGTVSSSDSNFNGCVRELFHRLKRSLQKILIVSVERSSARGSLDLTLGADPGTDTRSIRQAYNWLTGNMYVGPVGRGPLDPEYQRSGAELWEAFDFEAQAIIQPQHYIECYQLYVRMLEFVHQALHMSPFERLLDGFDLFTSMVITLGGHDVTLMDISRWEMRSLSSEELKGLKSDEERKKWSGKLIWSIKKDFSFRLKRSVDNYRHASSNKLSSPLGETEKIWTEFVTDLLEISLQARVKKDGSFEWSCDLNHLYSNYLYSETNSTSEDCSSCVTFDKFLYSKILNSDKEWKACNKPGPKSSSPSERCKSWRRLVKNLKTRENFSRPGQRTESYLKDAEVMVHWLSANSKTDACERPKTSQIVLPYDPFRPYTMKVNDTMDRGICHLSLGLASLIFWHNDCSKIF